MYLTENKQPKRASPNDNWSGLFAHGSPCPATNTGQLTVAEGRDVLSLSGLPAVRTTRKLLSAAKNDFRLQAEVERKFLAPEQCGCVANHHNSMEVRILKSHRHADGNHSFAGEEAWAGLRGIAIIKIT